VAPNLGGNAWSVVSDFHHNFVFMLECPNAEFSLAGHCVIGVLDQISPDLVQLRSERIHKCGYRLIVTDNQDSLPERMVS
jgi:hypothetical protein